MFNDQKLPFLFQEAIVTAISELVKQPSIEAAGGPKHLADTPRRVAKAMLECLSGSFVDPALSLTTTFPSEGSEMIHVAKVRFISYCAHHLMPFVGSYSFAYIPDEKIVGLSKIPRMIEVLCARPQVQEKLSREIVDIFQENIKPKGCAVSMDAAHFCMCCRGVKKYATTRTTALTGIFTSQEVKQEFNASVGPIKEIL